MLREAAQRFRARHSVSKARHGGKILADALVAHGVKIAFGVPGEIAKIRLRDCR